MTPDELTTLKGLLIDDEGFRQFPYLDTTAHTTIGYGRNLTDTGISRLEAQELLTNDINYFVTKLTNECDFFNALNSARQTVIVGMCFNLGYNGLLQFVRMFDALKIGDYESASVAILQSKAATQAPQRYQRYAQMMRTGELNNV